MQASDQEPWNRKQHGVYKVAYGLFSGLLGLAPQAQSRDWAPDWPGVVPFDLASHDGWHIHGWHWKNPQVKKYRGTVLLIHGFGESSLDNNQVLEPAKLLSEKLQVAVVAFDHRFHGHSGKGIPSFGWAESRDVSTVIDQCVKAGLPQPFALVGTSLGGMAAGLCAQNDARVVGAALFMPPASPRLAIQGAEKLAKVSWSKISRPVGQMIEEVYGNPVLDDGDPQKNPLTPAHSPRMLYAMSEDDEYGYKETFQLWESWYPKTSAKPYLSPAQAPKQKKWFIRHDPKDQPSGYFGHGMSPLWPDKNKEALIEWGEIVFKKKWF